MRFEDKDVCKECQSWSTSCDGTRCEPIRQKLRSYSGIRYTADGFDCALPVCIDSHSKCSFDCSYCFSDNIIGHRGASSRIGQTSIGMIENILSGKPSKHGDNIRLALKYDNRNKNGYPCPIQVGGVCDPCDNIERNQGWLLKLLKLAIKYEQPLRLSTKGITLLEDDYLKILKERPELFWVAFSLITPDDKLLSKVDRFAPNATERLNAMNKLTEIGVTCSLRFRPIIPGLSDSTPDYPMAYETLIERASDSGATAISAETVFVPGMMTSEMSQKWSNLQKYIGIDLQKTYYSFGKRQSCTRPSYLWSENIMHKIVDTAHKYNMDVGISDPVWKQLSDCGCCCGIRPDHPVFGNWERESATNALITARDTKKKIYLEDISPPWSYKVKKDALVAVGAGPEQQYGRHHTYWSDHLRHVWNNVNMERNPTNYFQGAIVPIDVDSNGNLVYEYRGLERKYLNTIWKV